MTPAVTAVSMGQFRKNFKEFLKFILFVFCMFLYFSNNYKLSF